MKQHARSVVWIVATIAALLAFALVWWGWMSIRTPKVGEEGFREGGVGWGFGGTRGVDDASSHLHKRSSCYSCERAFPAGQEWRGQPSKCFSCEAEMARTGGDPFLASRTWHHA